MPLPKFTADASLLTHNRLYRLPLGTEATRDVIEPALCGRAILKCVKGIANHDPTAVIWCNITEAFCGWVY